MAFIGGVEMKRRIVLFMAIMLLISPEVFASSSIQGWVQVPGGIDIGGVRIAFDDVSVQDRSMFITLKGKGLNTMTTIPMGSILKTNEGEYNFTFTFNHLMINNPSYSDIYLQFPYLLEGESIAFDGYRIYLKSISHRTAVLQLSYGNSTKEITYRGKEINFENLRISLSLMPIMFDGYLYKGQREKIGEWNVTFDGYNITKENGNLIEIVRLKINQKEYFSEIGKTIEAEGLEIEVKDLIGSEYLRTKIRLIGAYINVKILPYFDGWISEGKTTKLGPYVIKVENIFGNKVYISIQNSCGMPLKTALIPVGNLTYVFSYGGLSIGALETREQENEMQVRIVAMFNEDQIPKIQDIAFLNVSFKTPSNAKQYIPFKVNVTLKNTGKSDLKYVEILPNISKNFEILGEYPKYIPVIKKGQKIEFQMLIKPKAYGNLTIGNIKVSAHAPYPLSCYGLESVEFSSEIRRIVVQKAILKYSIKLSSRNGIIGGNVPLNITVTNMGNSNIPFDLTIAVPQGFGVIGKNFTMYGKWLQLRDSIEPNQTRTYRLSLIPSKEGKYEVIGVISVNVNNKLFQNSTVITISKPIENNATVTPVQIQNNTANTNTTCQPKIVTQTIKVPVPQNTTVEVSEGMTLKQKILYFGGAFVGGIAFILLIAFIAAKLEERKR